MSSLNDSSGAAVSQNDSIPLEDEEESMSIYSDEEREGEYSHSEDLSDRGPSSLDYSSVSRTYMTPSQSQSRGRGAAAPSGDYTASASYYSNGEGGSLSYGYDDEDYEYSSGYESMTYGDSTLRSPHSELSSTFASFYYENELVVKTRSTLHFLRRPLYYLAFATAGSSAVGSLCRLATTVVRRHLDTSNTFGDAALGTLPGAGGGGGGGVHLDSSPVPSGYPNVPEWLQEVRAALPAAMEVPASWLLRRHNIPVLSDVVQQQQQQSLVQAATAAASSSSSAALAAHVSTGVQEAWQTWQKSGPAIPVALFLPLFSIVAIKVAQHVRPSQHSFTELLRAQQDAEDAEVASAYLSTTSPARPMSVSASPIPAGSGAAATAPSASSPGNTSVQSHSVDGPQTSRGGLTSAQAGGVRSGNAALASSSQNAASPPPRVPPVNIAGATRASAVVVDDYATGEPQPQPPTSPSPPTQGNNTNNNNNVSSGGVGNAGDASPSPGVSPTSTDGLPTEPRERSRSTTVAPPTHRHLADEADEDIDVDTGLRMELSPPSPPAAASSSAPPYDPATKPSPSVAGSVGTTSSSVQGRLGLVRGSTLRGDVVAAVAGTPDVREANVALMAAARYGCSAVLLPASLESASGLLEAPPSLDVAYVDDVVASAMDLADRRALTLLGVTARQLDAQAVPLDRFTHPVNSLYLFVSHEADNAAAVAAMAEVVLSSVYVGTTRSELPANQVFYDRLQKEKATNSIPSRSF